MSTIAEVIEFFSPGEAPCTCVGDDHYGPGVWAYENCSCKSIETQADTAAWCRWKNRLESAKRLFLPTADGGVE